MKPLFALVLSIVATALFAGPAAAAPLAPLPGSDSTVKRIGMLTASHPGHSGEATEAGCLDGQPIADIYFQAEGTGTIRVTAQRGTTEPNPSDPQQILWSQLVKYEVSGLPNRITIPVSGDGTPFNVVLIGGPGDKSGPGMIEGLVVTHEACDKERPSDAASLDPRHHRSVPVKIAAWVAIGVLAWLFLKWIVFPKRKYSSN